MRAEQFNFYVNPETEKELYDFLTAFPRMVRSNWIKETLTARMRGEALPRVLVKVPMPSEIEKDVSEDNVIRYSGEQLDIDEDDL